MIQTLTFRSLQLPQPLRDLACDPLLRTVAVAYTRETWLLGMATVFKRYCKEVEKRATEFK